MKIIKILILFIGLLMPLNNIYSQSNQLAQYRKGVELMERKFYNEAIVIFENLIQEGAFVKDCEGRIKEARKAISYITIEANDRVVSANEDLLIDCNRLDTLLNIKSNYKWKIDDYSSNLYVEKIDNRLRISYPAENHTTEERISIVKISAGEAPNKCERVLRVVHEAHPAFIECSSENLNSPSDGFTDMITVNTNVDWVLEKNDIDWCNVETDSTRITITVAKNEGVEDRKTSFVIKSELHNISVTININQSGGEDELIPAKSDLIISPDGKTEYVRIYSNTEWFVNNYPTWCQVERIPGTDTLKIVCTENYSGRLRDEQILLTTGLKTVGIHIKQDFKEFIPFVAYDKVLSGRNFSLGISVSPVINFLSTSASSDFKASVVNYGFGDSRENAVYKSSVGYSIGAIADIRLKNNLYVKTGLNFSTIQFSNKFKDNVTFIGEDVRAVTYFAGEGVMSYSEDYRINQLELPLMASYRLVIDRKSSIHLDLGPYINFGLSAKMKLTGSTDADNLALYKISNHIYTNEPTGLHTSRHYMIDSEVNLYDNTGEYKKIFTNTSDRELTMSYELPAAPYKRINYGIHLGVVYELAGFNVGISYKQQLSNMANERYWSTDRIDFMYNALNSGSTNMAGYKQRIGSLSLSLAYIFRYKRTN